MAAPVSAEAAAARDPGCGRPRGRGGAGEAPSGGGASRAAQVREATRHGGIGQRLRGEAEYADGGPSYGPVGPSRPSKLRLEGSNRRRKEDGDSRPTPAYRAKPSPRRAGGMNYYYFSPIFNFFPTTVSFFPNPYHIFSRPVLSPNP